MGVHFLTQYRNPLAFPAGYAPGFDPNHVAAERCILSAIVSNGGAKNILNGVVGTLVTSPTASVHGIMGPCNKFNNATTDAVTFATGTIANSNITLAAIFTPTTLLSRGILSTGSGNGVHLRTNASNSNFGVRYYGFVTLDSGFTAAANTPYFYAFTASRDSGAWDHRHVICNLSSGKMYFTEIIGTAGAAATDGSSIMVGNADAASSSYDGRIACAMISKKYSSLQSLIAWAADPWSFWYPNPGDNWIAAQAAAGGLFKITGNPRSLAGFGGGLAA